MPVRRGLLVVLTLVLLAGTTPAENWPQWRGPNNDGISNEKGLPSEWSETKNIAWKLAMPGMGGSTPAVWGDRLFLTSQDGDKTVALCVSTAGKELWRRDLGGAGRKARFDEGNGASASPSTDGKHVFFFVGTGELAAFDLAGKEAWRFNTQDRYGRFRIQFGMHTTPVLYRDRLYFQLIHSGGGWVVCVDKATGKDVWKVERKSDGTDENEHSYASAFLWTNGKKAYLVCHGNDYTTAHSLEDGKEIWRLGDLNPPSSYNRTLRFVASPVCTPDLIVVPTAKRGPVVGVKPDATGMITAGSKFEQWRMRFGTPDVSCPLVHNGLVYLCGEGGGQRGLTCLDAKTGEQIYQRRTHQHRHRASPVYADGKIYLTARDGVFTVVSAGREGKVLAENKLSDQTSASPAISGGRIYLRGFKYLWAIEAKK
jgi:outer membrane protein assembly factor BamB